nr:molybdenum cofactor guanylyltransferase [Stakelama flava]
MAGGAARRFGGDKALAMLDGVALIDHAARALGDHVNRVVVIGREHGALPHAPDRPAPDLGPLGGITGALAYAMIHGADSVLTVACDVPRPPESLFRVLARPPAFCDDHPVFGHWPVSLLPDLEVWLNRDGDRSVRGFARAVGALPVRIAEPIMDIDTREDLERAR